MGDIHTILKNTFGFNQFRGQQEEIIQNILSGKDTLVIMPTGGGKSLCYQIPALVNEGLTIVISPLIALMNDQVAALKQLEIPAGALHSHTASEESRNIIEDIESGHLKLLYVSPEKLLSDGFQYFLKQQRISLFAIDEAHCVSVWGNDFRPEYVKLAILKQDFTGIPVVALTATADKATQSDIIKQLGLTVDSPFLASFERKNIRTSSKACIKRAEQILYFLSQHPGEAGIIYCLSRKSTEQMADRLQSHGYSVKAYHAGLDAETRSSIQKEFQDDNLKIVCATIAFGMGIDKPNIRWIIHYNIPKNIEGYYQEIGRAGRNGESSEALLFYSWADYLNLQKFIDESPANDTFKTVQRAKLERMWQLATALSCRTNLVLNYFGEYKSENCNHCDICLEPPRFIDGTSYAQMALSGIIRTHESIGMNLLIDILRGSYKKEVQSGNYQELKTFGVGREVPFSHWRHYITQMINQGIIAIDFSDFSKLKTTPLSRDVLKGGKMIQLAEFVKTEKKKALIEKPVIDTSNIDDSLFIKLKAWRNQLARKNKVPAYIILGNKTLEQIASLKPEIESQLMTVDGIGEVKIKKYGKELLELVNNTTIKTNT